MVGSDDAAAPALVVYETALQRVLSPSAVSSMREPYVQWRVGSEASSPTAFGPSLQCIGSPLSGSTESREDGTLVYARLQSDAGAGCRWSVSAAHGIRCLSVTREREEFDEVSVTRRFSSVLRVVAALRQRSIIAIGRSGTPPVHGRRLSVTVDGGGHGWWCEAVVRGGPLGRGVSWCSFLRFRGEYVLGPFSVLCRPFRALVRGYAAWVPWTSSQLAAVDCVEHLLGTVRGAEQLVTPLGNRLSVALSAELESGSNSRGVSARLYCSAGASVSSREIRDATWGVTVGYALVPRRQMVRSRFAHRLIPREMECTFPWLLWVCRSQGCVNDISDDLRSELTRPACRVVWSTADPDHND